MEWLYDPWLVVALLFAIIAVVALIGLIRFLSTHVRTPMEEVCMWLLSGKRNGYCPRCDNTWEDMQRPDGCLDRERRQAD